MARSDYLKECYVWEAFRIFDKDDNLLSGDSTLPEGGSYAKSVNVNGIVPVLVEALKEAITEIETLKTKVAALEGS